MAIDYIFINGEENIFIEVTKADTDAAGKRLAAYREKIEKRRKTDE